MLIGQILENRKLASRGVLAVTACLVCTLFSTTSVHAQDEELEEGVNGDTIMLFDFRSSEQLWRNIDDVVMGGVSSSHMRIENDLAVFQGELSLENNGGFASIRSDRLSPDLADYDGVRVRVRGDGKKYQLRIRTSTAFDGPSYQIAFATTKNVWTEIDLDFSDFAAAFRGRQLPNHPALDPAEIVTLGFLIANKQAGTFRLEIESISAYRGEAEMTTIIPEGTQS